MDSDPAHHDILVELGDEANDLHNDMRVFVQNPDDAKSDVHLVDWSRTWRKKLEGIYYSPAAKMHNALLSQVVGSTISGLGWALGAALAGFIIAMLAERQKKQEEKVRAGGVEMSVSDLLPVLDGLIQRLKR